MFGRNKHKNLDPSQPMRGPGPSSSFIEVLEYRQLLSASIANHAHASLGHATTARHASRHHKNSATTASSTTSTSAGTVTGKLGRTIQFSQAPTAVQTGLDSLASTDGLTAPTSTQTVYLGNQNGTESYTLDYSSSGTNTRITVDENGNPVTSPTQTTTTWATLNGTGTGSNSAAAAEIAKIATALSLTAPADTTIVYVSTASGAATYSVRLTPATTTTTSTTDEPFERETTISVDASGNPVGRQNIPFSALPTAIQTGINGNLPANATALDATSTQIVNVRTENGTTTYSTTFTTTGTTTTITVDATGALANLPSETTSTFSAIPQPAKTELQTLATADGFTGTIADTQSVRVLDEANGTTIYTVSLAATDSTTSQTITITISSDQLGNPTVPPHDEFGGGGGDCGGGFGGGDFGGHDGGGQGDTTTTTTTPTTGSTV